MDDESAVIQQATPPRQCDICSKTFVRSEHLERHRRTHTKERPFICPHCPRSFQRSDVRTQHVKRSHGEANTMSEHYQAATEPSRKRVKVACDTCRKRKLRCDGEKPCRQCLLGGSTCQSMPAASTTQNRANRDSLDSSTSQRSRDESDTQLSHHLDHQPPTPGTTPGRSGATFTDSSLRPDSAQTPFTFVFESDPSRPTNDLALAESSVFAHLDARFSLDNDIEYAMMTDFWHEPALNSGSWLNDLDLGTDDFISLLPDHALESSLQQYALCMQEYFDRKSRATSPSLSPNKAASMWYSAPANLADHDLEIVNVFLNSFSRNVPRCFRLFQDSIFTVDTRQEFILAAAAVGGLYCSVNGSFEFSKAMYNDSRRLLLASTKSTIFYNTVDLSCEEILTIVKTFILNEIYGLCSGDKRSYEFVEAFHQDLVKAVQVLVKRHEPEISTISDKNMAGLLETLYILDCYRVVLLQRPPSLLWQHLDGLSTSQQEQRPFSQLRSLITGITNPGHPVDIAAIQEYSLATLSGLSPFLWHTMLLAPADQDSEKTPWNTDFVELAADKWLRSHPNNVEPSSQMLFHLMNITMHANLLVIQNYAHSPSISTARDRGREFRQTHILHWARGRHHKIAKWHAERLLACAEKAISAGSKEDMGLARPSTVQLPITSAEPSRGIIDLVHVPYCVYYATLVLWCGAEMLEGGSSLTRQSYLTRGRDILSQQNMRIASLLERLLRGIKK